MTMAIIEFEQQWRDCHADLPRAFTGYAPCRIVPPENRLGMAVEAGARDPRREARS